MATATLELVNPYSKLGLKRRPTYNEIINLIDENETITGNLPDRTATFYKASPEGSFFDGTDALELLKEQQNRIFQRQMQDLLLRQNVRNNGGTFNLERHRQNTSSSSSSSTPINVGSDFGTLRVAGMQTELQERARQAMSRQQQTGEAHARELEDETDLPVIRGHLETFLSGITSPLQRMIRPLPIPRRQPETIDLTRDEDMEAEAEEDFFPEEMTTAREEEPKSKTKLMEKISYSTNISRWSEKELEFQLFIRGTDPRDPENSLEGLRKKGRGKGLTNRQHLNNLAQEMINDGRWQRRVEEELLKKRISDYKQSQRPRGSRD